MNQDDIIIRAASPADGAALLEIYAPMCGILPSPLNTPFPAWKNLRAESPQR